MLRLVRLLIVTFVETIFARLRNGRLLPSWGFQFEWVVRFLRRDFSESTAWPYDRLRADLDGRRYPNRHLSRVTLAPAELGGVPIVVFTPPHPSRSGKVLYFHGGSYIFGSPETTHADLIARLALDSGSTVVAPRYRLAPEHPYPAALDDALAVFRALTATTRASEIVVAGDSAGGNLAIALQLALRDRSEAQAGAALLISPWLDLTASRASCRANERFDHGQTSFLLRHARTFAGPAPLSDPHLSPINADPSGLAPFLVQVGGAERLHDECVEFVDKAKKAGVEAELLVAPEIPHLAPVFAAFHPAAERATAALGEYVKRRLPLEVISSQRPDSSR